LLESEDVERRLQELVSLPNPVTARNELRYLRIGLEVIEPELFVQHIARASVEIHRRLGGVRTTPKSPGRGYSKGLPFNEWPAELKEIWPSIFPRLHGRRETTEKATRIMWGRWLAFKQMTHSNSYELTEEGVAAFVALLRSEKLSTHYIRSTVQALARVQAGIDRAAMPRQVSRFARDDETVSGPSFSDDGARVPGGFADEFALATDGRRWLAALISDLVRNGTTGIDKQRLCIDLRDLIVAGIDAIEDADAQPMSKDTALAYRDGLLLLFLGLRCVRLSNIWELVIYAGGPIPACGYVDVTTYPGYVYWPASSMKNGSRLRVRIPEVLRCYLDRWVDGPRKFLEAGMDLPFLWLTREYGRRMSKGAITAAIARICLDRFDRRITPHRIRDINASYIAENEPDRMWLASHLLGHKNERSRETYVQMANDLRHQRAAKARLRSWIQDRKRSLARQKSFSNATRCLREAQQ
jgi:hypothetical protein